MRDIIRSLGNCRDFGRLRLGIGHPGHASEVVDYVLRKATPNEQTQIEDSIQNSLEMIPDLVQGRWNQAMKTLHTQPNA